MLLVVLLMPIFEGGNLLDAWGKDSQGNVLILGKLHFPMMFYLRCGGINSDLRCLKISGQLVPIWQLSFMVALSGMFGIYMCLSWFVSK